MRIRTKLICAFLLAILIAMGSVIALVSWETRQESLETYEASTSTLLPRVNDYIENVFFQAQENAKFLAQSPVMFAGYQKIPAYMDFSEPTRIPRDKMNPESQAIDMETGRMRDTHPLYSGIFVGFDNGRFTEYPTNTWPVGWDPRKRPWYGKTVNGSSDVNISPAYSTPQGLAVCAVTAKVFSPEKRTIGVVGIDIQLTSIVNLVSEARIGKKGYLMLVENSGMVLANPVDKSLLFKKVQESSIPAFQDAMKMDRGSFVSEVNGEKTIITVFTGFNGWKIFAVTNEAEVYQATNAVIQQIILIGIGITILLLVVSFFLAHSISGPINLVVNASKAIANGDHTALPESRLFSGEMLTLRNSLDSMIQHLATSISTAEAKSAEAEAQTLRAHEALKEAEEARLAGERARTEGVIQAATRLEGIVSKIVDAVGSIRRQTSKARENADVQHDRAASSASAMEEMAASILSVADSASKAANNAEQTRSEAQSGGNVVRDVVKSISDVQSVSQELGKELEELGQRAHDIGKIMDMISDVADQTNLLALNAAIEAARAGEAGRGFAVVADEVRKLAEKTMSATGEVDSVVRAIRQGAETSVSGMTKVAELIARSTALADGAGTALNRIVSMVQDSADQVRSIATASEQQSAASEEISHSASDVNLLAGEMTTAMLAAESSVSDLLQQSTELENIITRLKTQN